MRRAVPATFALALVAGACVAPAATAEGRQIEALYTAFLVIAALVALVVFGLATFAIVRYRFVPRAAGIEPRQVHGNNLVEVIWTAVPLLIVGGLFAGSLAVLARTEARSAEPVVEIQVEAFRWGWTFSYPDEGVQVSGFGNPGPEIVVPIDRPVRLSLTSADVAHSWFVPRFLFKRDAIPGRTNTFEITVEEPGTYRGQCAEFCGIGHSQMPFGVRAVSEDEYRAWLEQASGDQG